MDEAAGVVRHHVATALIPGRVGTTLTRFFSMEGERLTLRPSPLSRGGVDIERALTWRRVG